MPSHELATPTPPYAHAHIHMWAHRREAPDLRFEPRDVARPLRLLLHVELIVPPRVALTPPAEGEAGSHAPVRRQRLPRRRLRLPPIFFGSTSLGAASQLSARDMRVTDTTRESTQRRTAVSVSSVATLELLRSGKRRPLLQVRSRPVLPPPCAMPLSPPTDEMTLCRPL